MWVREWGLTDLWYRGGMSDDEVEAWDPTLRREVGAQIARGLAADPARADTLARGLAPDGAGPGVRYYEYEGRPSGPKRRTPYQAVFRDFSAFEARLVQGDHGALELSFALLQTLDPELAATAAARLLPAAPWSGLGAAIGQALACCDSELSFTLLMDFAAVPYLRDGLALNRYPGGVSRAWAAYRTAGDLASANLDPSVRMRTLPLLSYLLRWDPAAAFIELAGLLDGDHHVQVYAAHALRGIGSDQSRALLMARLESSAGPLDFPARMAVRVLLETGVTTTIERLGGVEFLQSELGRPRLEALIDALRSDAFKRRHETRDGWLEADPRFAKLCADLRKDSDRALARLCVDLLDTLPAAAKKRALAGTKPTKKAAAKRPIAKTEQRDGREVLEAEMRGYRATLEALISDLRAQDYAFRVEPLVPLSAAERRVMRRLSKLFGPLPLALEVLWLEVGAVDLSGPEPSPRDPLVVLAPTLAAEAIIDEGLREGPVELILAPDALSKAGFSAGCVSLWLPTDDPDPVLKGGPIVGETLRTYLRRVLGAGGFGAPTPR